MDISNVFVLIKEKIQFKTWYNAFIDHTGYAAVLFLNGFIN